MIVEEQLQIEKKRDIVKILNRGLVELDFFTDSADISSGQVTSTYLNAYNKTAIQIINSLDANTEIAVCGIGESMSPLLEIDTIQKAEAYIMCLKEELNNKKRKRYV